MTRNCGGHIVWTAAVLAVAASCVAPPAPATAQAFQEQMQLPSGVTRPRTPLGPGLKQQFSIRQTAPAFDQKQAGADIDALASFAAAPVGPSEVAIFSLANVPLRMAWLDRGANEWETLELPSQEARRIRCEACEGVVMVSFFDGREQRSLEWRMGTRWLLRPENGRWIFEDVASLAGAD